MSQNIFPNIDPYVTSGIELAQKLNDFKDAVVSGLIGSSRPTALIKGGIWVKETSTDLELTLFDGTNDIALMSIEKATGAIRFDAEGVTASKYDNSTKLATTEFVRNNALAQFPNLTDSEDLDSIVGNGMYVQSSGEADLDNNYPVIEDGVLLVLGDAGVRTQTYWGADGKTYTRMYSSSTWSPWTNMPEGVVVGPASASGYAIATFDGTTGKKIQSTDLMLTNTTFQPVSPDESVYTSAPFRAQSMKYSVWRDGTTGDDAILNVSTATFVELYDDGLNSIAGLTTTGDMTKRYDRFTTLINTSNTPITIKHDSTVASVANERILTHTGSDIVLPPKRAITVRFSQTYLFKWVTLEYITTLDGQTIDGATLTNANIENATIDDSTITGPSIQNPVRLDPKKDTLANLTTYAATAQNGEIVYATDKDALYIIVGGELESIGGGGGVGGTNIAFVDTFEDSEIDDYTTTGTVELDEADPLHGLKSLKLTHPPSGYSQAYRGYPIDRKFRGKRVKISFAIDSDATQGNVTIAAWCGSENYLTDFAPDLSKKEFAAFIVLPNTNDDFFFRVRGLTETGKVTYIDDIVLEESSEADGVFYIQGDETTDGSWRLRVDDQGRLCREKREAGAWVLKGRDS